MKHPTAHRIKRSVLALMGCAMLTMAFQCGDDESFDDKTYNIHHSKCLQEPDDNTPVAETIEVSCSDGIAHVIHRNLTVSCGIDMVENGITVDCYYNGNTINIYERESDDVPQTNCLCHVINEFDIYHLEAGTYTLVFHSWGGAEPYRTTVTL